MAASPSGGASARAYVLWGDDAISRDEVVHNLRSRMLARPAGELNLSEFHAPELTPQDLITACDTVPFIDDRRLVIVHGLFSWRPRANARRRADGGADGKTDGGQPLNSAREAFLAYLPRLAPQTTLVLVEGALSAAQRAEIGKHLPAERADVRAFAAPQGVELERWLARRAQRRGGELGPRVAGLLREHGPARLEGLDQEVAKLVTYAGDRPVSTADLGELLPGGEIVIFALLDALAEGRAADALVTLRSLYRQGTRPEEIAPQVIALYRRLLACILAGEERARPSEVERALGVKLIEKLKTQARRFSGERCAQAFDRLLDFDRKLKRGEIEPEAGLEILVGDLAILAGPLPPAEHPRERSAWRAATSGG